MPQRLSTIPLWWQRTLLLPVLMALRLTLPTYHLCHAFVSIPTHTRPGTTGVLRQSSTTSETTTVEPQVFATGYSTNGNLVQALQEAVQMAVTHLPPPASDKASVVDLGLVYVSSLYDGGTAAPATTVIPTVVQAVADHYHGAVLSELIGCSVAGCIASSWNHDDGPVANNVVTQEFEGIPAVSVTLALLPDTVVQAFCVTDVPDNVGRLPATVWQRTTGIPAWTLPSDTSDANDPPILMLLPSPAFATELEDLVQGVQTYLPPGTTVVGGLASTVSSLSRAKVYCYSSRSTAGTNGCYTDACVGVALQGDVTVQSFTAQGAKPVGGIYQVVKGQDSTIQVIVLDEVATDALALEDDDDEEEEDTAPLDTKAAAQQAYAKARIPKPALAEANFIMRTLSDDDQAFMRRQLLIGVEETSLKASMTASDLMRLAAGEGHRFRVWAVASGGMKDGSVTLPLGAVHITPGMRLRFFVRESGFAQQELEALWLGYKKRQFTQQMNQQDTDNAARMTTPTACFVFPTLDRGQKFFLGKAGFESSVAARMLPGVPCIQGFFGNGVIGRWDGSSSAEDEDSAAAAVGVQGSCSGYFIWGSKSGRPMYNPADAALQRALAQDEAAAAWEAQVAAAAEDAKREQRAQGIAAAARAQAAPRTPEGELILKRREVHSGRALTVSTVEWSVAEKTATPTSTLEGFMWDKETEVDRFRERVPLANLVSQCRLAAVDPASPKPRNFMASVLAQEQTEASFVIIPELKRLEPTLGSLRRRYDIPKLTTEFTTAGAAALSVNCDAVLFGGSIDDITAVRDASRQAALTLDSDGGVVVPPILASDLVLYPYQLYKLRLAGADAVNLLVGALTDSKDLLYLTKIAASLQLQTLATCTSTVQLEALANTLPSGSLHGIIVSNRILEDFSFDMTGQQALDLLRSEALQRVRDIHNVPVLVEGRVGVIEGSEDDSGAVVSYVQALQDAGATGAFVGGGLVQEGLTSTQVLEQLLRKSS